MKAILVNAMWLMIERISLSLSGIFVSIYVARYLGPGQFGAINYLLATVAVLVPLAQLGADSIIFNRIARRRASGIRLMMASMRIRRRLFLLAALPLLVWQLLFRDTTEVVMLVLMLASAYFSVQDVYKIYYDATLKSKRNTIINNAVLILSILLRLGLVHAELSLAWFAVPYIVSSAIPYLVRRWMFRRENRAQIAAPRRLIKSYEKYLFSVGLPLAVSSLSIVIYTRIDQLMLGNMLGTQAVGWYSAATTLAQGWVFVPMAMITSLMPGIAGSRQPEEQAYRIRLLNLIVLMISLPVLLFFVWFAQPVIELLYGAEFQPSAAILAVCTLTAMFGALGTVSYRSMVLFSGYRFIALKMPIVAVINVVLNILLIPRYGLMGAAISTLFSEFMSLFVLNAFFQRGKITRLLISCFYCIPPLIKKLKRK
ncbi:flippase [Serratia entomophila]|uniref:flippase n=1 Tax=Serratia entomophila TaxID=42906 RepID=UPI0021775D30|nr:flippase [Serratia entomophila]CAI0745088.1 colanic acid exporter [Serratia entomophila]CAI1501434.1 colanic acid exporter [Serratia entomophila]CAI1506978.1 colanic acid exporter [Serratia entomophila]CAI1529822.1 colanic acid exporter [Serratia entomophila]CAI1642803.1 colanic acid exporter [Serratia entomophila]